MNSANTIKSNSLLLTTLSAAAILTFLAVRLLSGHAGAATPVPTALNAPVQYANYPKLVTKAANFADVGKATSPSDPQYASLCVAGQVSQQIAYVQYMHDYAAASADNALARAKVNQSTGLQYVAGGNASKLYTTYAMNNYFSRLNTLVASKPGLKGQLNGYEAAYKKAVDTRNTAVVDNTKARYDLWVQYASDYRLAVMPINDQILQLQMTALSKLNTACGVSLSRTVNLPNVKTAYAEYRNSSLSARQQASAAWTKYYDAKTGLIPAEYAAHTATISKAENNLVPQLNAIKVQYNSMLSKLGLAKALPASPARTVSNPYIVCNASYKLGDSGRHITSVSRFTYDKKGGTQVKPVDSSSTSTTGCNEVNYVAFVF